MKKIKMSLSQSSIKDAIKELKAYKQESNRKNEIFIDRLSKRGLEVVQQTMESVPGDDKGSYNTEIIRDNKGENILGAAIRLSGDKVLFIEFSAGITYGMAPGSYPIESGKEFGYGTYPEQTHALDPKGWWYKDDNGTLHHSYGNRAYMPMYHAEQAIILAVSSIARETFG